MKKQENKVTKNMLIDEVLHKHPELGEVLVNKYNFHCIGCMAASMETLEEGAIVHGMTKKKIEEMVKDLNQKIKA